GVLTRAGNRHREGHLSTLTSARQWRPGRIALTPKGSGHFTQFVAAARTSRRLFARWRLTARPREGQESLSLEQN
ncbi:MAG: hypothetical protein P8X63_02180, partial [Desulfuromonadaceae bacterium]